MANQRPERLDYGRRRKCGEHSGHAFVPFKSKVDRGCNGACSEGPPKQLPNEIAASDRGGLVGCHPVLPVHLILRDIQLASLGFNIRLQRDSVLFAAMRLLFFAPPYEQVHGARTGALVALQHLWRRQLDVNGDTLLLERERLLLRDGSDGFADSSLSGP